MTYYNFKVKGRINTFSSDDALDILRLSLDDRCHNIEIVIDDSDGVVTER